MAIFWLLTDSTTSPRWKPRLCAGEPLATSTITTPSADGSSRSSSASAGDRLATLAPVNGERALITSSSRGGVRRGLERDRDRRLLAAAHDAELRGAAERLGGEAVVEGVGVVDRLAVDDDDQVAGLEAGARGGAAAVHGGDQRAGRPLEAEALGDLRRHRLQPGAEPGPLAPRCRRSCAEATTTRTMLAGIAKPMPCEPPEREKIAVLMPTSLPVEVDQRAAGIAGIDGGVGLDEELVVGDADLRARHRRHDAVGHGLADAERIADGEHQVADLQRRRNRAKSMRREALALRP